MLKGNVRTDRSGHWLEQSILNLFEEAASDAALKNSAPLQPSAVPNL
jgi:hypothetical protein